MRSEVTSKLPSLSVVASRLIWVSTLVMVTVAPGIRAPFSSATVPIIRPLASCAIDPDCRPSIRQTVKINTPNYPRGGLLSLSLVIWSLLLVFGRWKIVLRFSLVDPKPTHLRERAAPVTLLNLRQHDLFFAIFVPFPAILWLNHLYV